MSRICVVRQYYFPLDPRVRREVDAVLGAGHEVDVVCLGRPGEPSLERSGRLTVRRVGIARKRAGILRYAWEYASFLVAAAAIVTRSHLRRRYDLIQVNSMPDALVFASAVPRLLGARVLLDLQECMPEFFATKFGVSPGHPFVRAVARIEQSSIRFAHYAITCTGHMRQAFLQRGAEPAAVGVVLNGADEDVFDPTRYLAAPREAGGFVLIAHGTVEERYGLDTVVRAVALLAKDVPDISLRVYGDGSYLQELRDLAHRLGVDERVYIHGGWAPMDDLLRAIASADAGVVAMKRDAFRDLTLCNKMHEYVAMHKPAVVSRTRSVVEYYGESCFQLFESDDPADLARAIRELYEQPELRQRLVTEALRVSEPYRWQYQREHYQRIVADLIERRQPAAPATRIGLPHSAATDVGLA